MCKCDCGNDDSPKTFKVQVVGNYKFTAEQCGYEGDFPTAKDIAKWLKKEYISGVIWLDEVNFPLTVIIDGKVAFNDKE